MNPVGTPKPHVTVEWDREAGQRTMKSFDDCFNARRFFAEKYRKGKNPRVRRCEMSRKNRGSDSDRGATVVAEQEQETQVQEGTDVQRDVVERCDQLKEHLKQASILFFELEFVGAAKYLRSEHDRMDGRKAKLVKRAGRDGSREEREANKAAKKAERIAKLKEQLAKLTEED